MARSCSHPLILCLGYKAVTRDYCSRETLPLPGCGTKPEHDGLVSSSYLHEGPVVSATPQSCLWDQRRLALNQALILTQPLPDLPCFLLSLSLSLTGIAQVLIQPKVSNPGLCFGGTCPRAAQAVYEDVSWPSDPLPQFPWGFSSLATETGAVLNKPRLHCPLCQHLS